MVVAGVVQDHPGRRGAHRALMMADEEIGWKAKARAWVEDSDTDSDDGDGSHHKNSHHGSHASPKGNYFYRRFMYISDTYLSQAKYQTYALMFLAVVITVGGGIGYHYADTAVTMGDGMYAVFTWCVRVFLPMMPEFTPRRPSIRLVP